MAFPCSWLEKNRRPSIYLLPGEIGIQLSVTHLGKAFRTSCNHLAELFNRPKEKLNITYTVVSFHKHLSLTTWIKHCTDVEGMLTTTLDFQTVEVCFALEDPIYKMTRFFYYCVDVISCLTKQMGWGKRMLTQRKYINDVIYNTLLKW